VLVLTFFGAFHFFEAKIQPLQQMGNSTNIADVIKVIFLIRCLKSKPKCIYLKLELTKSPSSFSYSEIKAMTLADFLSWIFAIRLVFLKTQK